MESNELIAEFMGGIKSSVPNLINLPQTIGQSSILCVKGSEGLPSSTYKVERINELQYHSSWDLLMPVVEKIENFIFDENNSYNVTIGSTNYCVIQDSNRDTIEIIKDNGNSKLDTTYQAVVEFINQYNKTI